LAFMGQAIARRERSWDRSVDRCVNLLLAYPSAMTTKIKTTKKKKKIVHRATPAQAGAFVDELFGEDLHALRVRSLADAVTGVTHAASLSVSAIGAGLAAANGLRTKHAIKQVDRLLSNKGVVLDDLLPRWAGFVLGARKKVRIALDWTDFEKDDQVTLAAYVITEHGRATPLLWKTHVKSSLSSRQTDYEAEFVDLLARLIPEDVDVTLVADRGFASVERYDDLRVLGVHYLIRFRGNVNVTDASGVTKRAEEWVPTNGRARRIEQAGVTHTKAPVPVVVCVRKAKMKEPWCLATDLTDLSAPEIVKLYGRRFTIEETFRDVKDQRFGMGLKATSVKNPERRDRLLFVAALAHALLTLLGAAGEKIGFDRMLKANTSKKRTHSLYRQGLMWFQQLPKMPEDRLRPLMAAYSELLRSQPVFAEIFGTL